MALFVTPTLLFFDSPRYISGGFFCIITLMLYYRLPKNRIFLVSQKALIVDKGKILILKYSPIKSGKIFKWELPGGLLEPSEKLTTGLKREVKEETNLTVTIGKPVATSQEEFKSFRLKDGRKVDVDVIFIIYECNIIYECRKLSGKIKLSWEHKDFRWVSPKELKNYIFSPGIGPIIAQYTNLFNAID